MSLVKQGNVSPFVGPANVSVTNSVYHRKPTTNTVVLVAMPVQWAVIARTGNAKNLRQDVLNTESVNAMGLAKTYFPTANIVVLVAMSVPTGELAVKANVDVR